MAWNEEPQPTLRTERLILRPFSPADGPRVEQLAGAREVADTTASIPHPYPAGGGAGWIGGHHARWAGGSSAVFALALPGTDEAIGAISLEIHAGANSAELGYYLGVPYWGRGYMTEAARALVDFGFETLQLNRIEALHLTRNPASGRVMEKAGMAFEGVHRQALRKWGVYEDLAMRAIIRSDWEAQRG